MQPPYAGINWILRDAVIKDYKGEIVFQQKGVEAPDSWSDLAVQVVAQKYFRGKINDDGTPAPGRETSVRQLIDRVVNTIADWAGYQGNSGPYHVRPGSADLKSEQVYFDSREEWEAWKVNLKRLLVDQKLCFNSPVWFNVGVEEPQCSACFILRLEDYMSGPARGEFNLNDHGLLAAQVKEGLIFSRGSGSGVNLSRIRSSKEWLSKGGKPTGPLSFGRGLDTWASSIKSGGKTRRAAIMRILDVDHPDIFDFINVKAEEELVAKALIAAGYPSDMDGPAYQHAFYQNANLSVRVSDEFMLASETNELWSLISRSSHYIDGPNVISMCGIQGKVLGEVSSGVLLENIAQQAWHCGDPGIQFHDTINRWHTCLDREPIFASNPCSEYMFLDETSCNLASLNLKKFFETTVDLQDAVRVGAFIDAIRVLTTAMDVIVSGSSYPTENIRNMSQKYRTLGVGYANLGGMLMSMGLPYDSDQGRTVCSLVTSAMTAAVYEHSAMLATRLGPFRDYAHCRGSFYKVMRQHHEAHLTLDSKQGWSLADAAEDLWGRVVKSCREDGTGIRNAQATVLAPTGTIAFMMDCETTGIEPELGLVKYKTLSGGGRLAMPNPSVEGVVQDIVGKQELLAHIAKGLSPRTWVNWEEDYLCEVLRTSFPPKDDPEFCLSWEAHVKMMAAAQPFISGAISKTVNMPNHASVDDIERAYRMAWTLGLKAIAVYRDGSKGVQPMSTSAEPTKADYEDRLESLIKQLTNAEDKLAELEKLLTTDGGAIRKKAPDELPMLESRFEIGGHKGWLKVGFRPENLEPCEVWLDISKSGSTIQGFASSWCILFSWALQYGVPLEKIVSKFSDMDFEPKGFVPYDKDVRICRSIPDYVVRKVQAISERVRNQGGILKVPTLDVVPTQLPTVEPPPVAVEGKKTGRLCDRCGSDNVILNGKCITCFSCGKADGGCFGP